MNLEQCLDELYGGARNTCIDPSTIPCIETSDVVKLCKNPLVSVRIVTYNHEPYIRQCLESILSQKTDFEYEVVIGEDCSQDRTREICFEFQRRHPDKVRVLWSDENLYKISGNQARAAYRCRGKYMALLEGDDYWSDPLKLQKQINLIRRENAICCLANYATLRHDGTMSHAPYSPSGVRFCQRDMFQFYPHTSTYVVEREVFMTWRSRFPDLRVCFDVILMHCLIDIGKVVMLPDEVSVYRITGAGIATSLSFRQSRLFAVRQYLDLYLHGPRSERLRFGSLVLTYVAFFFNRSLGGEYGEEIAKYSPMLTSVFRQIFIRQFWHPRTIRAAIRYASFRYGGGK